MKKADIIDLKKAFTLAEVLLTLAIIGVVAALTIPAVVTKAAKEQYVTGLKKAFNTLKSVEREAIREHGALKDLNWTWTNADFNTYLKPHFDILKDCGVSSDEACFAKQYAYIDGTGSINLNSGTEPRFVTSDGVSFLYSNIIVAQEKNLLLGAIYVDVNGAKGPNKLGRDLYMFLVYKHLGIRPFGAYNHKYDEHGVLLPLPEPVSSADVDSYCKASGSLCCVKVLSEGKMDY